MIKKGVFSQSDDFDFRAETEGESTVTHIIETTDQVEALETRIEKRAEIFMHIDHTCISDENSVLLIAVRSLSYR